ncbi:lipopolysaccharide biosynthesis protein [Stenotrophomonas sp. JAG2]|uniref:lipopolysaccharide biosynthesis protein n=1 Tax=Stenotrophomonas sp. JAG2 TaxID=3229243 RepID=UPI0034E27BC3
MIIARTRNALRHPVVGLVMNRGLGQVAVLLSTFWVARLVTPDVYGELGLFTSFCALLSMASGARFEIRALVCKTEAARRNFVAMSYAVNMCLLLIALPLCVTAAVLGLAPSWVALVPIGVLLSSLVTYVLPTQNSSPGQLSRLGRMNLVVSFSTAVLQIVGAKIAPIGLSLIGARVVAWAAGALLLRSDVSAGVSAARSLRKTDARRIYRSSKQEIFYGSSSALLSVVELQCAVYVLSMFSEKHAVGMYWMGFNLLFVPFFVVSGSLRPLFLRHLGTARKGGAMARRMFRYVAISFAAGLVTVVPLVMLAVLVTRTLLSDDWQDVQFFAALLGITLLALVARLPISFAASALRLQRLNLAFGVIQVLLRIFSLAIPLWMGYTVISAMAWFTVAASLGYVIHTFVSLWFIRRAE